MRLYLLRHGHAPSVAEAHVPRDADRPLSDKGRADVRKIVLKLVSAGGKPSLILHSPLRRAVETAREAAAELQGARVEAYLPLSNVMSGPELAAALDRRLGGVEEALLVGHQPQLGEFAAHLLAGTFPLSPAGLIALERAAKTSSLLWFANPEDIAA